MAFAPSVQNKHPPEKPSQTKTKDVCHIVALPFTLKSILRQKKKKKNYGNSNISPCKNIIFKKSS
jgi:hypothetical protein